MTPNIKKTPKWPVPKKPVQVRPPARPVREIIKGTPQVTEREVFFVKTRVGELVPINSWGHSKSVFINVSELPTDLHSELHTHIFDEHIRSPERLFEIYSPNSLPSGPDLKYFVISSSTTPLRTMHVASIDKKGNTMGYVTFHISEKTIVKIREALKDDTYIQLTEIGAASAGFDVKSENVGVQIINAFNRFRAASAEGNDEKAMEAKGQLNEFGVRLHIMPLPGYTFEKWRFVKK